MLTRDQFSGYYYSYFADEYTEVTKLYSMPKHMGLSGKVIILEFKNIKYSKRIVVD